MKIDQNQNLVLRLSDDKGDFVVHSIPLPTTMFSANWRVFRAAYEDMSSEGIRSSVAVALLILRDVAKSNGSEAAIEDVINTLKGATTIIRGKSILLDHSDLDEDYKEEVLNRLVFFYVWQLFVLPTQKREILPAILSILDLELTKSTVQELLSSTSTQTISSETTSKESAPTTSKEALHPI